MSLFVCHKTQITQRGRERFADKTAMLLQTQRLNKVHIIRKSVLFTNSCREVGHRSDLDHFPQTNAGRFSTDYALYFGKLREIGTYHTNPTTPQKAGLSQKRNVIHVKNLQHIEIIR